jgi:hypothetical protein
MHGCQSSRVESRGVQCSAATDPGRISDRHSGEEQTHVRIDRHAGERGEGQHGQEEKSAHDDNATICTHSTRHAARVHSGVDQRRLTVVTAPPCRHRPRTTPSVSACIIHRHPMVLLTGPMNCGVGHATRDRVSQLLATPSVDSSERRLGIRARGGNSKRRNSPCPTSMDRSADYHVVAWLSFRLSDTSETIL